LVVDLIRSKFGKSDSLINKILELYPDSKIKNNSELLKSFELLLKFLFLMRIIKSKLSFNYLYVMSHDVVEAY
jgi:hypothetical protein